MDFELNNYRNNVKKQLHIVQCCFSCSVCPSVCPGCSSSSTVECYDFSGPGGGGSGGSIYLRGRVVDIASKKYQKR